MMLEKLIDGMLVATRDAERRSREDEEKNKNLFSPGQLVLERDARSLAVPAKKCAMHHRERETYYTKSLENAEKELREKGVSMEVYDQSLGAYLNAAQHVASGNITSNQTMTSFQPRIDQALLDKVKVAKQKMLEHREEAKRYEEYARAFWLADEGIKVKLTVHDVTYFRLVDLAQIPIEPVIIFHKDK